MHPTIQAEIVKARITDRRRQANRVSIAQAALAHPDRPGRAPQSGGGTAQATARLPIAG